MAKSLELPDSECPDCLLLVKLSERGVVLLVRQQYVEPDAYVTFNQRDKVEQLRDALSEWLTGRSVPAALDAAFEEGWVCGLNDMDFDAQKDYVLTKLQRQSA